MRVLELAIDLRVTPATLLRLLRQMGIPVSDAQAPVSEEDASRIMARIERERRAGHKDVQEAIEAAIEESKSPTRRRRRRRRASRMAEAEESQETAVSAAVAESSEQEAPAEAAEAEAETDEEPTLAVQGVDVAEGEAETPAPEEGTGEPDPEAEVAVAVAEGFAEETEGEAESPWEREGEGESLWEPEEILEDEHEGEAQAEAVEEDEEAESLKPTPAAELELDKPQLVRTIRPEAAARARRKAKPAASAGPAGRVRIQAEGYTADGRRKQRDKKKRKRQGVDQGAVQENIQRVMAELKGGGRKRRRARHSAAAKEEREAAAEEARQRAEEEAKTVRVNEFLTVAELAELIDVSPTEIIGSAFKNLGLMVTINQRLDFDQIELLLDEFNFQAVREEDYGVGETIEEEEDIAEDLKPRPPVVTVMGHVDHGKTKLLDSIRHTNVVAGEAGGITQHMGAYHVVLDGGKKISFLDTPGHAAFTAMRARGADITDIVILVVAADDSVMPQTIEAISHARNAGVPLVVAVNKIDLPAANPEKVKQELLQHGVTVEDFGGDVLCAEISAKNSVGIDDLLEKVLLQAELLELQANPDRDAVGSVVEAKLDVGKGPVLTVLVEKGTLRVGDSFVCGLYDGRVRAMLDERGQSVEAVGPGIPAQVLGSPGVPQAGDSFQVMDAVQATEISQTRQRLDREKQLRIRERGVRLGDFSKLLSEGEADTLPLIIKGDVDGSVQAVADALEQLSTGEVAVEIVHRAVGAINESDVLLAQTAGAVIIGFRVRPDTNARTMAEREDVDIHVFDIIYEAVDQVKAALEGMLAPERREKVLGAAEVRETFKISKVGTVAGCYVAEGVIERKALARVIRNGIVVYDGEIGSLKRFKDDVKEVREGFECGIGIANFNDVKVGDVIECYAVEEVARTLASTREASS
jgi:translation initiation factor IF-2